jgi:hypothetical protein
MGLSEKLAIKTGPDGQTGTFARRRIAKGEILMTFDGRVIDHRTATSVQIDDYRHINGTEYSTQFLNHSCEPTAYMDWNGPVLKSARDLKAGEEITHNYTTSEWETHSAFICKCGSPKCYGTVKGFRYLTAEQQKELESYLPEYMKRRMKRGVSKV